VNNRAVDLIGVLDERRPNWRDHPVVLDHVADKDSGFRADLALAFFTDHPGWMDDVCPAVIDHQLEWIVQVMDNVNACGVLERTADSIYKYFKKNAHEWLLEEEQRAVAWG